MLVLFLLEYHDCIFGTSIIKYIYSTVQNIKLLAAVVNQRAVVILNFHSVGERAAGGAGSRRGANDDSI